MLLPLALKFGARDELRGVSKWRLFGSMMLELDLRVMPTLLNFELLRSSIQHEWATFWLHTLFTKRIALKLHNQVAM